MKRVAAFAKRLLQIALQSPGPFAAGTLFLLSEVLKVRCLPCTLVLTALDATPACRHPAAGAEVVVQSSDSCSGAASLALLPTCQHELCGECDTSNTCAA